MRVKGQNGRASRGEAYIYRPELFFSKKDVLFLVKTNY